ncbi:MAG: class I SAM-dependent methyltransferase [Candidatus Omnitrophota bacterium]
MKDYEKSVANCYSTWGKTYYDEYYGDKAPYPPVHTELLRSLLKQAKVKNVLDAGCGPASFLRDIINEGIELFGFDLTSEMVEEAKLIFEKNGLSPDNIWKGSILDKKSFILPSGKAFKFDAVICSGVMPHISERDEDEIFENLLAAVKPGGLVALEARNQLFSLFTMNRYSCHFIQEELIRLDKFNDKIKSSLEEMKQYFCMGSPPIRKGKENEPGYDEVLSRTHNPIVLKNKFEKIGLREVNLKFYHFHALPPIFSSALGDSFVKESLKLEDPDDWRGHFMASAFFVVGKK